MLNWRKTHIHTNPNIKTKVLAIGTSNFNGKNKETEVGKLVLENDGTWSLKNNGEGLRNVFQYAHFTTKNN